MWNILIVIIIAIIIFALNPLKDIHPVHFQYKGYVPQKTRNEVNQKVNEVQQQVDYARQLQQQEQQAQQ